VKSTWISCWLNFPELPMMWCLSIAEAPIKPKRLLENTAVDSYSELWMIFALRGILLFNAAKHQVVLSLDSEEIPSEDFVKEINQLGVKGFQADG
jgi:hypothetical protein